jgi:holo-[acyl-carrier protein] synthase
VILGIGTDLCDIRRIEALLDKYGDRFLAKVFSDDERAYIASRPLNQRAGACAKRYAAKEACAKALGSGIADGVRLGDLCVVRQPSGKPVMVLAGGAARRLAAMTPPGGDARIELSLSDEYPLAMAYVVIHAVMS